MGKKKQEEEEQEYIETPLTMFVGGHDQIVWPYFSVLISVGTFMAVIFL